MKKIQLLGLAVVGVLALSAVTASGAFALESVFLVNGVKVAKEVETKQELVAGTELLLEDMKVPIIGAVDISCTAVESKGAVGDENNAKLDLVTTVEFLTCKSLTTNATLVSITAVNLPWLTELLLVESKFLDDILPISGQPGYKIEVTVFGIKSTDECGSSTKSVDLDNTTENDIIALFLETETANCTVGGANEGLIVGEFLTVTTNGEPLAVSEA